MQLTILPNRIDRRKAAMVAENTIRQASYPASDPRHEPVLRELVEMWIEAGCRYARWQKASPKQASILSREANRWTLYFVASRKGKPLPVLSSHPYAGEENRRERIDSNEYIGYQSFAAFLLCAAPRFDVGKCDRCGNFFWNRWGHVNKRFCSRRCTVIGSATERQAAKISKRRREKNARIRRVLQAFICDKPNAPDWKAWVAKRARVTRSYLTRTLHRGTSGEPNGLKLTKRQLADLEKLDKKARK